MRKQTENTNDGKEYQIACRKCDGSTYHTVLKSVHLHESERDIDVWKDYEIVICNGCKEITFRLCSTCSEDMAHDPESGEPFLIEDVDLYPNRIAGRKELRDVYSLPDEILKVYRETHTAICGHLNILAGIGIRALVETVCREKKADGSNLETKIDDLVTKGILTKEGADILHGTRILGNRAAHEAIASQKELDVAMDIVENLLQTVYLIPEKARKFKK